jgi:hypothetical protein
MTDKEPTAGSISVVSGWGTLTPGGSLTLQLHAVEVVIIPREECNRYYDFYDRITENMICVGVPSGGKDACKGVLVALWLLAAYLSALCPGESLAHWLITLEFTQMLQLSGVLLLNKLAVIRKLR